MTKVNGQNLFFSTSIIYCFK